jgi:hypothetical protein
MFSISEEFRDEMYKQNGDEGRTDVQVLPGEKGNGSILG